jgi:Na+/H+-dicarboxylate symporter
MGNSFLFPGTFTRLQSLKEGAKKGMKIILGLIPIFILAGFIEGFLTRYAQDAPAFAWSVIILSVMFVLYYFVIYPIILMDTDLKNAKN